MAELTRYEPWSLLSQFQRELEKAYQGSDVGGNIATAQWSPTVDIKEEPDRFVIYADIPGVKPEEIDVNMEDGVLTIKGEKQSESKTEENGYKRVERTYGSFYRRFALPDTADPNGITAKSKHGVLELVIPKRETAQPKKINVVAED
ncbi:Hsp20/alpha crystallin family protein [methane-oxidizing endosymbiont of Gigantopelta aegis]|uniref:Hsp20/alpha crystallin family protein n=1 Tax=methane-oxidizing endosymbiont of Gigantopelta aegis TaxID=2794938 RepID=UPI0018DB5B10|nr:Hsp20/alpha crystallin family protein [methane-oxidizing endosymbiont of Gigantopelta aegis]